jgi:hypothetical protein
MAEWTAYINRIDIKPLWLDLARHLYYSQPDIRDVFPRMPTAAEALAGCMVLD